jgi:putative methionine-R-sulfoxide reductase with GAF domain
MFRHQLLIIPFYFFIYSLACCISVSAQDLNEEDFTLYTKQKGLSDNSITGIVQDSTGFIWASTSSGLNRFNGTVFEQFHSNSEMWSLPSENIRGLVWIDKYRIVSFGDGIHITDTRKDETWNIFIPYKDMQYQYKFNWIISVTSNKAGDLFVLARSGFYHFNYRNELVFRFDYYPEKEVSTTSFSFGRYLIGLDDQKLAIASEDGIYFYNSAKRSFRKMTSEDCVEFAEFLEYPTTNDQFFQVKPGCFFVLTPHSNSIKYIDLIKNIKSSVHLSFPKIDQEFDYRSRLGLINDSTFYITGKTTGFYLITWYSSKKTLDFNQKKYFDHLTCRELLVDRDKSIWIATTTGLYHQNSSHHFTSQITIPSFIQNKYPNLVVDDICLAGDKLCAATRGYAGLLIFNKDFQFIKRIGLEHSWRKPDNIHSILAVNNNEVLIATNGPLFIVNILTGSIKEVNLKNWNRDTAWISDLCKDNSGHIWVASDNLYKYDLNENSSSIIANWKNQIHKIEWIQRIEKDDSDNIWMAGHGLLRYNVVTNRFDKFINIFPFIKIPDKQINSFKADHNNNLWINTNNNGLLCYNISTQKFRSFTRENGLPDNNIASMVIIRNQLWIASFSGIACLDLSTFLIKSFGIEDGFPEESIAIGSKFFYDEAKNKLYIGFRNKIIQFDPDITSYKGHLPQLFIQSITADNKNKILYPGNKFTTSWKNKDITLTIGTINFSTGLSQRFAYKLDEDTADAWHWLGKNNTFSISNLSAGEHNIAVKLYSSANRWPEQVKYFSIELLPPFWQKTWFLVICIYTIILSLYFLYRWQTGLIQKKERTKTTLEKLKAEEYKSQFELEQISNYFSSTLADKHNVDDVLWDVSKNLIGRMNYEDCMIYLWNEDKTKMVQKASFGPKGSRFAINAKIFDVMPGQGIVGHVMNTMEPLIIKDTRTDNRYRVDDVSRLSEICVPIIHNSELIGIIDSEHSNPNHFTEKDIKILITIATLIGNKIRQLESEHSLEMKQKELAYINQQLAEAQLSALQTQMNPHFIFNCLNSIKAMILEDEQQKASRYMSKFANLLRITLNQSKEVFTTLNENIEHLENYLAMEKLRFDDCFTFRITTEEDIDGEEILIPTMMIQPLVENAIWHGLMPKRGTKKLYIHFSKHESEILCIVEDNGIGIERSEELKQIKRPLHQSVGLTNLHNRIKILNEKYKAGCTLFINNLHGSSKAKSGTRAELRFNIFINKPSK